MYDAPLPPTLMADWVAFLDDHRDVPRNVWPVFAAALPEIFDHPLLFPLQRRAEMTAMLQLAASIQPETVMEIGADKGGSFFHWAQCLPTVKRAAALECRGVPYLSLFQKHFTGVDFFGAGGSSYDAANVAAVREWLGTRSLDVLFIDGDKCGTDKDFAAYAPMVRPGGLVMIHDVNEMSILPSRFFYSLKRNYRITAIIDGREAKSVEGRPPKTSWEGWLQIWQENSCGVGVVHI